MIYPQASATAHSIIAIPQVHLLLQKAHLDAEALATLRHQRRTWAEKDKAADQEN